MVIFLKSRSVLHLFFNGQISYSSDFYFLLIIITPRSKVNYCELKFSDDITEAREEKAHQNYCKLKKNSNKKIKKVATIENQQVFCKIL